MDQEMRDRFMQIADNLGVSASGAVRVFVNKFIECGGFPFDVREHSKA
jgi:DNA-damage-inducible protein J